MMAVETEPRRSCRPPPGVRRVEDVPRGLFGGRLRIPDVKVRCRRQAEGEPPMFSRPRFGWNLRELSGALGDLGTFLPHIIGAITVVGMAPAGILTTFGLFYMLGGAFYGLPIAVQPMKAASAAVIIEPMDPHAIAGAGLVIGLFFLIVGATGLVERIARVIPPSVAAGLQLGLGLSLAALGIELLATQLWLGLGISALILVLLGSHRLPAALVALIVGVAAGQIFGLAPPFPDLELGLHLPPIVIPSWEQIVHGTQYAVLPQIPLTLTNAIIVTAALTRELFPKEIHPVNERNLSLTTGLGNLLAAPFGGYPMCHGAGGLSGHYRFGARTATAPLLIGLVFVALGLLLGDGGFALLQVVPDAVLGALLLFSGVDLAQSSKPQRFREVDLFIVLLMAAIGVALNPAIAFAIGLPLAYAAQRGWLRP
jgi:MFS superfamily sulfate permease-like transporter